MSKLGLVLLLLLLAHIMMAPQVIIANESSDEAPAPLPGLPHPLNHKPQKGAHHVEDHHSVSGATTESSSSSEEELEGESPKEAEAPISHIRRLGKHHHSRDVAGGGVVVVGLVTAIFAAVFCYIRVTRNRDRSHCTIRK